METKDFVEQFIKIEIIEEESDPNVYGLYPFQLIAEFENGKMDINALAVNNVQDCYVRVNDYLSKGAKKIFMALDFPHNLDIDNDFIAIFSIVEDKYDIFAIPYDTETGEVFAEIYSSKLLDAIMEQFKLFLDS